jgi:hypothetical protein
MSTSTQEVADDTVESLIELYRSLFASWRKAFKAAAGLDEATPEKKFEIKMWCDYHKVRQQIMDKWLDAECEMRTQALAVRVSDINDIVPLLRFMNARLKFIKIDTAICAYDVRCWGGLRKE